MEDCSYSMVFLSCFLHMLPESLRTLLFRTSMTPTLELREQLSGLVLQRSLSLHVYLPFGDEADM
jgi:hypothetical protein